MSSVWLSAPQERTELLVDGKSVVQSADRFHTFVARAAGEDAANLFAQPQIGPDGSVSWVDRLGAQQTAPLAQLPDADRKAAEATLRVLLAKVEALRDDPQHGKLVAAALSIEGPDAIRVAENNRPIIAGWGAIAPTATTSDELARHHDRTLGPYLNFTDAPILGAASRQVAAAAAPRVVWPFIRAPLIAAAIAAVILLLLLLPGVLLRDHLAFSLPAAPSRDIDLAEANRTLEEQIRLAEQQLAGDVCLPPGGGAPRIQPAPTPTSPDGQPGAPPDPAPTLRPPVQPSNTPVPPEAVPSQAERPDTLAKLLDDVTVLIVTKDAIGTGFFISPELILTNRHVIDRNDGFVVVGNKSLGRMTPVEELAVSASTEVGQPDFALLKLKSGRSAFFLSIAVDLPAQLQNVIAAGYPQIVLTTDSNFRRLRDGDPTAIPDLALTTGTVVVVQNRDTPTPVILHRASISPGNSGGPLVDECGRLVGVNTFVKTSDGAADRMHYSLAASSAVAFLKQHGVSPTVVAGRCTGSPSSSAALPDPQPPQPSEPPAAPAPAPR